MIIQAGNWQLALDPLNGGMIRSLTRGGEDILRPMPATSADPIESACFPLAPYVNRIAHGTFEWEGARYQLAPNHPDHGHPLHGTAWLTQWSIAKHRDDRAVLIQDHVANDDWPWSFTLSQSFTVSESGLEVQLALRNTDESAMPAGLGFHPWFTRQHVTGIAFTAQSMWLADTDMLPTTLAPVNRLGDWEQDGRLDRPDLVDHCYEGWSGSLRIGRTDGDILLLGDNTDWLHLFVPPEQDFFCAEPQDTMPNAVNKQPPHPLAPNATRTITMRICNG